MDTPSTLQGWSLFIIIINLYGTYYRFANDEKIYLIFDIKDTIMEIYREYKTQVIFTNIKEMT